MTPEEELHAAVRQAINDSESAAGTPDHLLDLQATAAVGAMLRLGWVKAAGWEYAVMADDVTAEICFNTEGQALAWVGANPGPYVIVRRPVGVWERLQ
jgi:hypothetical protein